METRARLTVVTFVVVLSACSMQDERALHELIEPPEGQPKIIRVYAMSVSEGDRLEKAAWGAGIGADVEISAGPIRVVVSSPLERSVLDRVGCADGRLSDVAPGAGYDELRLCAGRDLSDCTAACVHPDPFGDPVGVLDENNDGIPDSIYTQDEIASLVCDGVAVALFDNRQRPTNWRMPDSDLDREIVLSPPELPPGSLCRLEFAATVVSTTGARICAPPDGDVAEPCPADGDTSLIALRVTP